MADSDWRKRLSAALEKSGKSKRAVSLESGNGPGYVHSILSEGKEPTVEKLMSVCDAMPTSTIFVLFGVDIAPDDLVILKALDQNPRRRQSILDLLSAKAS